MTHNAAIEALKNGNEELAWTIAQTDEGLLPEVTKSQWLAFAHKCIEGRKNNEV